MDPGKDTFFKVGDIVIGKADMIEVKDLPTFMQLYRVLDVNDVGFSPSINMKVDPIHKDKHSICGLWVVQRYFELASPAAITLFKGNED